MLMGSRGLEGESRPPPELPEGGTEQANGPCQPPAGLKILPQTREEGASSAECPGLFLTQSGTQIPPKDMAPQKESSCGYTQVWGATPFLRTPSERGLLSTSPAIIWSSSDPRFPVPKVVKGWITATSPGPHVSVMSEYNVPLNCTSVSTKSWE